MRIEEDSRFFNWGITRGTAKLENKISLIVILRLLRILAVDPIVWVGEFGKVL